MLAEIFLLVIVFYLLYRFVFNFLVPVIKTTRHVRQQFQNMQEGMDGRQQQPTGWQQPGAGGRERHSSTKGAAEDYIDFEEIKPAKESRR
ncbi:MAG TPA: hypothetical protein VHE54_05745 [Puia sp.]|nr:hypothetical protein [Puia sp.]